MTREEHLEWSKQRALEYLERGQLMEAITSMMSDLSKHEELKNHPGLKIGELLFLTKFLREDRDFVRRFIVGFR